MHVATTTLHLLQQENEKGDKQDDDGMGKMYIFLVNNWLDMLLCKANLEEKKDRGFILFLHFLNSFCV